MYTVKYLSKDGLMVTVDIGPLTKPGVTDRFTKQEVTDRFTKQEAEQLFRVFTACGYMPVVEEVKQ